MCLITTQKKAKIAKMDMTCYKLLEKGDLQLYPVYYPSMSYKIGVLYKTRIKLSQFSIRAFDREDAKMIKNKYGENWEFDIKIRSIGQGFHSAKTKKRLLGLSRMASIFKCTIPKGSKYFTNISGLMVSNQIIIVKECPNSNT